MFSGSVSSMFSARGRFQATVARATRVDYYESCTRTHTPPRKQLNAVLLPCACSKVLRIACKWLGDRSQMARGVSPMAWELLANAAPHRNRLPMTQRLLAYGSSIACGCAGNRFHIAGNVVAEFPGIACKCCLETACRLPGHRLQMA